MKCAAVVRTSQNGQFFIKSSLLPQWTEHPHSICLLVNLVHYASSAIRLRTYPPPTLLIQLQNGFSDLASSILIFA